MPEHGPHPLARCPYCGATKPCITWSACSRYCRDFMQSVPRESWALPLAPVWDEDDPVTEWTGMR